jgi:hypothetical protein
MGSFTMKEQSELIMGPNQTPIAIQKTTTLFATSERRSFVLGYFIRIACLF